jgi:hypothetical protein
MMWSTTEKDLTGGTQIGDLLQIVLETITPMLQTTFFMRLLAVNFYFVV